MTVLFSFNIQHLVVQCAPGSVDNIPISPDHLKEMTTLAPISQATELQ